MPGSLARSDRRQIPALTGIRAFAAAWVVAFHLRSALAGFAPEFVVDLAGRGYLGVDLFFVLSGFIISHTYAGRVGDWRSYLRFLGRRLGRLYPLHLVTLAALMVGVTWVGAARLGDMSVYFPFDRHLVFHALMIHAWGITDQSTWNLPSWSVSGEWLAYLSFPVWAAIAARFRGPLVASMGAGLVLLAMVLTLRELGYASLHSPIQHRLPRILGEFVAGCLAYQVSLHARRPVPGWVADLAVVGVLGLASTRFVDPWFPFACVGLIVALAHGGGRIAAALRSRPTLWLGTISYSIYLVHQPLWWLRRLAGERWVHPDTVADGLLTCGVYLVALVAISHASYWIVERPARRAVYARVGEPASAQEDPPGPDDDERFTRQV